MEQSSPSIPPPAGLPVEGIPAPAGETPEGPRRWPWWLGLAGIGVAFVGANVFGVLAIGIGAIFGASASDPPPAVLIVSVLLQDLCFLGFPLLLIAHFGRPLPWMLGLRPTRLWPAIGWLALGYVVLLGFSAAWSQIVDFGNDSALVDDLGVKSSTVALLAGAFIITVLAPIAEETLFRGFLFPTLRNAIGLVGAMVVTGIIFGAIHAGGSPVGALLPLALFGVILCVVYYRTQSLLPCMALHCVNNVVAYGSLVKWTWEIPVCMVVSLGLILLAYRAVVAGSGQREPSPQPL